MANSAGGKIILIAIWEILKMLAKEAKEEIRIAVKELPKKVRNWWNGKKIGVIGPTAAGKNSFYNRLSNKPIPEKHIETTGIEKVTNFIYEQHMPDRRKFRLCCKRALNVGGGTIARERAWLEACKNADVIFYIVSVTDLKRSSLSPNGRIYKDMVWITKNIPSFGKSTLVHILVNKMDVIMKQNPNKIPDKLLKQFDKLGETARQCFGPYAERYTGFTPTSMKDDHYFAKSLPEILKNVYNALNA